jgi:hypothetical protein
MAKTVLGTDVPEPAAMGAGTVVKFLQDNASFGESQRFKDLDRREAHWRALQYEHQQYDWWGKPAELSDVISPESVTVPGFVSVGAEGLSVRERRPMAPRHLVRATVNKYSGLLFSEARVPQVHAHGDEAGEAALRAVASSTGFWSAMRAARDLGGAMGSVCVTAHLRAGNFCWDVHNPKHVTVLWKDRRSWEPRGILLMYKYVEYEDILDPKTREVVSVEPVEYLFRRIVTDQVDTTFKPLRLDVAAAGGVTWDPDMDLSATHGLGFFPGAWIQNHVDQQNMDGDADCEGAWQLADTIDRLTSQGVWGSLLNLDPTAVLKYDLAKVDAMGGVKKGSDNALHVGENGDAKYMEMEGTGIEAALKLTAKMEAAYTDLTGYVFLDPATLSGAAQSAKALEYLHQPMLDVADGLRTQYGRAAVKLLDVVRRIGLAVQAAAPIPMPDAPDGGRRVGVLSFNLPPRTVEQDGETTEELQRFGDSIHISLVWPKYFQPTPTDEQVEIGNANTARTGGLVQRRTAVKAVASIFGVEDIDSEVAAIEDEEEKQASMAMPPMPGVETFDGAGEGAGAGPGGGAGSDPRAPAAGAGGMP